MTAFAFIMTFLVGAFSGVGIILYIIVLWDEKDRRNRQTVKDLEKAEMPFNVHDLTKTQ